MPELTTIILAAGDGKRMHSKIPKLLHRVAGLPIVGHVARAALDAGASTIAAVVAPGQDAVKSAISAIAPEARFFEQGERLGTAHAAKMARPAWEKAGGYLALVYGDHPLLHGDIFRLVTRRLDEGWDAAILGFEPEDPTGYGRFLTDGDRLLDIREHKDANVAERQVGLCNACILAFRTEVFRKTIDKVKNDNVQSEYYLGDLVALANEAGYKVGFAVAPADDVVGVNSRFQLAQAEHMYQQRMRHNFMNSGVTLQDPSSTYFSYDTVLGKDVSIEPNVIFGPGVTVAEGVHIKAFSHIEGASIGEGAIVGPFARLRPGTNLAAKAKVGNFVELKNAKIGEGAKVNHLSYMGDAVLGPAVNIGAGAITCNYDGVNKHVTTIGEGAFVGSNSALVAPVSIGEGAVIGAGSTISSDVEADALALTRASVVDKPGGATRLRNKALEFKEKSRKDQN
ncbi:MAG TPA: bifunctional UDP-N-acetylglucosamine diphosphorylase/glucosamine-1-phosphate N-acetyltransferase GlmU [Devosia sp.]|nr:bifunctional UDP-N-acetylglucosamine diphosphorylase/glucosamine-1-phosphate N-acetyltransferase GlmU [Devosia sp.]